MIVVDVVSCESCGSPVLPSSTVCGECGGRMAPTALIAEEPPASPHCTCGGNDLCVHCVITSYDGAS